MITNMKQKLLSSLLATVYSHVAAASAFADEKKIYDARLEGYENNYTLDSGGTGLTWLLLVVLGAICIGVLFKSGSRTHLD
jgi:hypothetical protein